MTGILLAAILLLLPQECTYSESCLPSECAVADAARGGQKCVPKQYAVMVWEAKCLSELRVTEKTTLEAPMREGEPDMAEAKMFRVSAAFKRNCGHVEIRTVK